MTAPFTEITLHNTSPDQNKKNVIAAVYIWGYRPPGQLFIPLYVGKTRHVYERLMQHYCRFRGGEYGILDRQPLEDFRYRNIPCELQRIYEPESFHAMRELETNPRPGHLYMVAHFVFRYVEVPDLTEHFAAEVYLSNRLQPDYLLSTVRRTHYTHLSEDTRLKLEAMAVLT